MDSFERFDVSELPQKECFYNDLSETPITESEYEHAQAVWNAFKMATLKDYHDTYLATDIMSEFSKVCLHDYGLNPKHYVTLSGFSFDAMLWMTKAHVQLLTDPHMHLFIESSKRGGMAVISGRHRVVNNPYLPLEHYDPSKENSNIMYTDANNLYGLVLSMPLPISDFTFPNEDEIEQLDILSVPRDGDTSYFLEVDLGYPEHLHDLHNSMPLAPENIVITRGMLSDVTVEMGEKFGSKFPPTKKLCLNLNDKMKYVLHFVNLQFYLKHGTCLRKIHHVLSFKQSSWIEPYITYNTEKRKLATDTFSKDLYKLLSNLARIYLLT